MLFYETIRYLFVLLLVPSVSQATTYLTRVTFQEASQEWPVIARSNRLLADAAPLAIGGIGFTFERTLSRRFTLGPGVSIFKLKSDQGAFNGESEVTAFGVHGRYFFSDGGAERNGFYGLGGIQLAKVTTTGSLAGAPPGSKSESSIGPLLGAGYQVVPKGRLLPAASVLNLGLIYGRGFAVRSAAQVRGKGSTEITETGAADAIFFEIALGMRF